MSDWRLGASRDSFFKECIHQWHSRFRNGSRLTCRWCGVLMLPDQPQSGALERALSRQHLPERDSERIKVRTNICSDSSKLFGTGVSRCPGKSSLNRNLGNRIVVSSRTFG